MPAARSTSPAFVLDETTAVSTPAARSCSSHATEPGNASTPSRSSARSTSACLRSPISATRSSGQHGAAGAQEVAHAVGARLAVDVGGVLALEVERGLAPLCEHGVEGLLPTRRMQRGGRGEDTVHVEQHGVVAAVATTHHATPVTAIAETSRRKNAADAQSARTRERRDTNGSASRW